MINVLDEWESLEIVTFFEFGLLVKILMPFSLLLLRRSKMFIAASYL
jgi:hypothetical protein